MTNCTMRLLLQQGQAVEIAGPGDLTDESTDAIVNAANSSLLGGGGVDGAIHRTGGPAILAACREIVARIGRLPAGKAVITTGGNLTAKYVIHTVGPFYRGGQQGESEMLASCHLEAILLADDHQLGSVAFPAISTGAYGYPVAEAAPVAISSVSSALLSVKYVKLCRFVLFDARTVRAFERAAEELQRSDTSSLFRMERVQP